MSRFSNGWARWYMVFVLTLGMIVAYIDRVLVSLLVDPIKNSLGITDFQFSLLQGLAFIILYATAGVPLARLADRHSRRLLIAGGILAWSAFTTCCGLATTYAVFLFSRVGVGLGESTLAPASSSLIASSFPSRALAVPVSVFTCGAYIGAGLAFFLAGFLFDTFNRMVPFAIGPFDVTEGWRVAFLAAGAVGVVVAALMLSFPEPPRKAADAVASLDEGVIRHLWAGRKMYVPHFSGFALLMMISQVVYAWIPATLMRTYGVSPAYVGVRLSLIMALGGVAGSLAGGFLADRIFAAGRRDGALVIGMAAAALLVVIGGATPLMPSAGLCAALLVPLVFLMCIPFGAGFGSIQLIAPPSMAAQVASVYLFSISVVGGAVGPALTAALTDYAFGDPRLVRYSVAIVVALCAIVAAGTFAAGRRPFAAAVRRNHDRPLAPAPVPQP